MSFKKKPRVYEILRTPEVWEKVILCTNDFSSCRFSASSFFADDIRVIPPLVLNKLCKLQEPSLLPLHFLRVYIQQIFAEMYFLEKKDVISCSTSSCATLCSIVAISLTAFSRVFVQTLYISLIRHIRWTIGRNFR